MKNFRISNRFLAFSFYFLFIVSSPAQSDTITLKSGKVVHGKIRERSERQVQLDVGLDFPITYYADEIQDVVKDNQGPSSVVAPTSLAAPDPHIAKADHIEQEGLSKIDEGQMDEGLALLRQAIQTDPKANRHLNLGGILFGNGVALSKEGKKDEALQTFRESEQEIQEAIKMFDPSQEMTLLSQAYYWLGELYAKAFNDTPKAKEFYKKSVSFYEHPQAQQALQALETENH